MVKPSFSLFVSTFLLHPFNGSGWSVPDLHRQISDETPLVQFSWFPCSSRENLTEESIGREIRVCAVVGNPESATVNICRIHYGSLPVQVFWSAFKMNPDLQEQITDPRLFWQICSQPPLPAIHSFTSVDNITAADYYNLKFSLSLFWKGSF